MKMDVFYYKSDMHERTVRFSILCTPTDGSDETHGCILIYCRACLYPTSNLTSFILHWLNAGVEEFPPIIQIYSVGTTTLGRRDANSIPTNVIWLPRPVIALSFE